MSKIGFAFYSRRLSSASKSNNKIAWKVMCRKKPSWKPFFLNPKTHNKPPTNNQITNHFVQLNCNAFIQRNGARSCTPTTPPYTPLHSTPLHGGKLHETFSTITTTTTVEQRKLHETFGTTTEQRNFRETFLPSAPPWSKGNYVKPFLPHQTSRSNKLHSEKCPQNIRWFSTVVVVHKVRTQGCEHFQS